MNSVKLFPRLSLLDVIAGLLVIIGLVLSSVKSLVGADAKDLRISLIVLATFVAFGEHILPWLKRRADGRRAFGDFQQAARTEAEESPYVVLRGLIPPLSKIYVDPLLLGDETSQDRAKTPKSLEEILERVENLIVVGDPGAGKSAVANHLATLKTSNTSVRVRAKSLAGQTASFPMSLRAAVCSELGLRLSKELPMNFFGEPPVRWNRSAGDRWLVVIDGLDEVTERNDRKNLLSALVQRSMDEPCLYQFVITSRPMDELRLLDATLFPVFRIQWFDPERRTRFAKNWFEARDRNEDIPVFIERLRAAALEEVTGVPLLLTMAAVIFEEDRQTSLPRIRAGLYERFIGILLSDDARADEEPLPAFRTLGARRRLLEAIAAGQFGLVNAAVDYTFEQVLVAPEADPEYVRRELRGLLVRTGLLVLREDGEEFLHFRFEDYLYLSRIARKQPDPTEMQQSTWVGRWQQYGYRDLVLLLLGIWGDRRQDVTRLVQACVDLDTKDGAIFAGEALAEGAIFTADVEQRIVENLVNHVEKFEFLGAMNALVRLAARPMAYDVLLRFARDPRRPAMSRIDAARAIGEQGEYSVASTILLDMIKTGSQTFFHPGWAIDQLAKWRRGEDLKELVNWPRLGNSGKTALGKALKGLGLVEEGIRLLNEVATDQHCYGLDRFFAVKALQSTNADVALDVLRELVGDGQPSEVREPAAIKLLSLGEYKHVALNALADVAADSTAGMGERQAALQAIGRYGAREELPAILALARSSRDSDIRCRSIMAAVELGACEEALALSASDHDPRVRVSGAESLLKTNLRQEATSLLLELAKRAEMPSHDRIHITKLLMELGYKDVAYSTFREIAHGMEMGTWEVFDASEQLMNLGYIEEGTAGFVAIAKQPRRVTGSSGEIDPRIRAALKWASLEATDEPIAILRMIAEDLEVSEVNRTDAARALRDLGRLDLIWDLPLRFI
jgi:NACHT domain